MSEKKLSKKKSIAQDFEERFQRNYPKQSKQRSSKETPKEVRLLVDAYHNLFIPLVHVVLDAHSSGSSSRAQEQIQQITLRYFKLNPVVPQVSPSSTSQRKLLRLKNSSNKRHGVERLYNQGKKRKRTNQSKVLRKYNAKIK